MKNALKIIMMACLNAMMVMTFILAPIPGPTGTDSYSAHAADDKEKQVDPNEGCREGDQDSTEVYKAGCDFNDDLSTTDAKDHYPEGIKGIIEQFAGAAFAMIGVTLFFNPIPQLAQMCPSNVGAAVTFPVIQAGCLSYLLGEIAANSEFKKASQVAVDKKFGARKATNTNRTGSKDERAESRKQAKQNKDDNNKQLQAYDALEEIYQHQVAGLEKKVIGAGLAEAAFVTATGLEISNIMGMKAACEAFNKPTAARDAALLKKLETVDQAALDAQALTYDTTCATPGGQAACPLAIACHDAGIELAVYSALVETHKIEAVVSSTEEAAEEVTKAQTDNASLVAQIGSFLSVLLSGVGAPAAPKTELEGAANTTKAGVNDTKDKAKKAERLALISTLEPVLSTCSPVGAEVIANVQALEINRQLPGFCCGTHTIMGATLDSSDTLMSYNDQVKDAITALQGVSFLKPTGTEKYYVKVIVENALKRIAYYNINQIKDLKPVEKIQKIASADSHIKYIMDNQDSLLGEENLKREYENYIKEFRKEYKDDDNVENFMLAAISKLKSEMIISSAHAMDFKSLLNIGVKATMLYFLMGSWMRENAFPKPTNRAWTWGIMAGVNAAILMFDMESKKNAEERLERVQAEKAAFLASHAEKTKFGAGDDDKEKYSSEAIAIADGGVDGAGSGVIECAVPKGNSFAPAGCPSVVPRSRFKLNSSNAMKVSGKLGGQMLGKLNNATFGAATGGVSSANPSLSAANMGSINKLSNALKKRNEKLIKDYDKFKSDRAKSLKGKKKPISFAKSFAKFKRKFSGNPSTSGVDAAQLAKGANLVVPKIEKLKKQQKVSVAPYKPATFKSSGTGKNFDFDLGDGGDGGTTMADGEGEEKLGEGEESLDEFVVNAGEINENEHVNIFKLISNRYLMSYPKLLNERKKKK